MAKRPLRLKIRIPPYRTPRNAWRRELHERVAAEQRRSAVEYAATDRLEIEALIYMKSPALGGAKSGRTLVPIIPNDCVVYRAIVEKREPPGQSHGEGHLIVRRLSSWRLKRVPRLRRKRGNNAR